ncbi:MAG: RHS repeat-associated core domain-containing protein [Verrucomicrobiota bacterium]
MPDGSKDQDSSSSATSDGVQSPNSSGDCSGSDDESDDSSDTDDECSGPGSNCPEDLGSISHRVNLALFPNEPELGAASVRLFSQAPVPNLASENFLSVYGSIWMRIESRTRLGNNNEYRIIQANGSAISFLIADDPENPGESIIGRPMRGEANTQTRVTYVTETGDPATWQTATYLRQYRAAGGYVEYPKAGGFAVRMVTDPGRVYEFDQLPIEIVANVGTGAETINTDSIGFFPGVSNLRQLKTPAGLIDVVRFTDTSYEIRKYAPSQIIQVSGGEVSYEGQGTPIETLRVVANLNSWGQNSPGITVTRTIGSFEEKFEYFSETAVGGGGGGSAGASESWSQVVTQGGFVHSRSLTRAPSQGQPGYREFQRRFELQSAPGGGVAPASGTYEVSGTSYGFLPVSVSEQFGGGASVARTRSYNAVAWDPNSFGRITRQVARSGAVRDYAYDDEQRMTMRSRPFGDPNNGVRSQENYSYEPNIPQDIPKLVDYRPRRTIKRVDGNIVAKTFNSYFFDNGEYVEREEMVSNVSHGAGNAASLITEDRYHGAGPDQGRLKSSLDKKGNLSTYTYAVLPDDGLEVTKTNRLTASGTTVEGKSMREVTTKDSRGWAVSMTNAAYVGGGWVDYERIEETRNDHGKLTERKRVDLLTGQERILLTQTWDGKYLTAKTDLHGCQWTYSYNQVGMLIEERRLAIPAQGDFAAQEEIVTTYTGDFQMTDERMPKWKTKVKTVIAGNLSLTSTEVFDDEGRVISNTDENGYTTFYSYSEDNLIKTETLPNGGSIVETKAPDGKLLSVTGDAVIPKYYSYEGLTGGIRTSHSIAEASGPRTTDKTIDPLGRILMESRPAFDGNVQVVQYQYGAGPYCGPSLITKTGEPASLFIYDQLCDRIRSGKSADDTQLSTASATDVITERDSLHELEDGRLWIVTRQVLFPDANSDVGKIISTERVAVSGFTESEYSIVEETDLVGNTDVHEIRIDSDSILQTEITVSSGVSELYQTVLHGKRVVQESFPGDSGEYQYTYDSLGREVGQKSPRHTEFAITEYAQSSNLVESYTDAAGFRSSFAYQLQVLPGAGKLIRTNYPDGSNEQTSYDLLNRIILKKGTANYDQEFNYSIFGELIGMITRRNPSDVGDETNWVYEAGTGLLLRKTYPDGSGPSFTYDTAGNRITRTWARGVVTRYGYDGFNRLVSKVYENDPENTPSVIISRDRIGRPVLESTVGVSSVEINYDPVSMLPVREEHSYSDGAFTQILDRSSDSLLRPESLSLKDGTTLKHLIEYGYGSESRLKQVTSSAGSFDYFYDASDGELLERTVGPIHAVSLAYEENRDLITVQTNTISFDQGLVSGYSYTYDSSGRREAVTVSGSSFIENGYSLDLTYNDRDELVSTIHSDDPTYNRAYLFDGIGNRVTSVEDSIVTNYVSNSLNQYESVGGQSFTYDSDGNSVSSPVPADLTANSTLVWDAENRLRRAVLPTGASVEYFYDSQSRRIKTVHSSGNSTFHVFDKWNEIFRRERENGIDKETVYTWGSDLSGGMQEAGGVGGLLAVSDLDSGEHFYPAFDGNGNISEYLSEAGEVVAHFEYDPFGKTIAVSGSMVSRFDYRFSSKPQDSTTGLYYYGYRFYDQVSGRWMSRDPIAEEGGINLYGFVGNFVINSYDILGKKKGRGRNKPGRSRNADRKGHKKPKKRGSRGANRHGKAQGHGGKTRGTSRSGAGASLLAVDLAVQEAFDTPSIFDLEFWDDLWEGNADTSGASCSEECPGCWRCSCPYGTELRGGGGGGGDCPSGTISSGGHPNVRCGIIIT